MAQPKMEYRYQKMMEMVEECVRKTFRFLVYDTFSQIKDIQPFKDKPTRDQ